MAEASICGACVQALYYNGQEWVPFSKGFTRLDIYKDASSFRLVGIKLEDMSVIININLNPALQFRAAAETFHQMSDGRSVYGFQYTSTEEANALLEGFKRALSPPPAHPQPQQAQASAQQSSAHHQQPQSQPQQSAPHAAPPSAPAAPSAPSAPLAPPAAPPAAPSVATHAAPPSGPPAAPPPASSAPLAPPADDPPSAASGLASALQSVKLKKKAPEAAPAPPSSAAAPSPMQAAAPGPLAFGADKKAVGAGAKSPGIAAMAASIGNVLSPGANAQGSVAVHAPPAQQQPQLPQIPTSVNEAKGFDPNAIRESGVRRMNSSHTVPSPALSANNAGGTESLPLSDAQLAALKNELLREFRKELEQAKAEIINAIKAAH